MSKPSPILSSPRDINIKAGQTIVLHDGKKVIIRAIATKATRYFTAWQAIVGTDSEVDAKIAELQLS